MHPKLTDEERQELISMLEGELDMNAEDASTYVREYDDDALQFIIERIQTLRQLEDKQPLEEHHIEALCREVEVQIDFLFMTVKDGHSDYGEEQDLIDWTNLYNKLGGEQE